MDGDLMDPHDVGGSCIRLYGRETGDEGSLPEVWRYFHYHGRVRLV